MKKVIFVVAFLSFFTIFTSQSLAVPQSLNYQGYLVDSGGVPVNVATDMTFRIYDDPSAGTLQWDSGLLSVDVNNGVYNVVLGEVPQPPIDPAIFAGQLWLGITVDTDDEMVPRQPLTSVGQAIRAQTVENLCREGDFINCYSGPFTTLNVGECKGGYRECIPSGTGFSDICSGEATPSTEICDGLDNDCEPATADGAADPTGGQPCDGPDSDLCVEGVNTCAGGIMTCSDITSSTLDLCNGADDDCDPASADGSEDPQNGMACDGTDSDLCNEGTMICDGGALVCSDATGSSVDICNGSDDDCDPASADGDEDPLNGAACDGPDTDLCEEGFYYCDAGVLQCTDFSGNNVEICDDSIDNDCDGDTDLNDSDCATYSHSITIDGTNDFAVADESFATTSVGYTGYITWDSTYLYIGLDGPDFSCCTSNKWVLIYLGGPSETLTWGYLYNVQQPALPFPAQYHIGWAMDGGFTHAKEVSSGLWVDAAWDFTGDWARAGDFFEMRIPLVDIGVSSPGTFQVHISVINESSFWTYSGVPSSSFTDTGDPDYSRYFTFDTGLPIAPNAYDPIP